ncbi:hypothetical protein PVAND_003451 [Polypedilum vanderplanki]|uniref:Uncharacterized protein n=1 Tax=Polypedilum vanderplanki TaxID=319348 RepID=A0A9J6BU29_POLVA|nr:hypothetical protein PVAND_003451 [Polypedilum vanderplanki]
MEDEFFVIAMIMVGVFIALSCCMFGIFGCIAYHRRSNRTLYSTPVVITDQSFTPHNQSQRPQYPINLQTNVQQPSSLPSYVSQQPPLITHHNHQLVPSTESSVQIPMPMPVPYDSSNNESSQNNLIYPTSTVNTTMPLPSNSNNNNSDDDAPPSYYKIDKLRN